MTHLTNNEMAIRIGITAVFCGVLSTGAYYAAYHISGILPFSSKRRQEEDGSFFAFTTVIGIAAIASVALMIETNTDTAKANIIQDATQNIDTFKKATKKVIEGLTTNSISAEQAAKKMLFIANNAESFFARLGGTIPTIAAESTNGLRK